MLYHSGDNGSTYTPTSAYTSVVTFKQGSTTVGTTTITSSIVAGPGTGAGNVTLSSGSTSGFSGSDIVFTNNTSTLVTCTITKSNATAIIRAQATILGDFGKNSDMRLKENIEHIGTQKGYNIYTWNCNTLAQSLGIDSETVGVMAQEVQKTNPEVITEDENGYLLVDYKKLFGEN